MANICINNLPAGIDSSCFGFESPVKNIAIVPDTQKFATVEAAKKTTAWKSLMQALDLYVPSGLASYEADSEEPKINTTAYGRKFVVREGLPGMKLQLESSIGDFQELLNTLKGGMYRVYFLLQNGNIKGTTDKIGQFMGYKCSIHAHTNGIPSLDAPETSYPVELMFTEYEEFRNSAIAVVPWNADRELVAMMPYGLVIKPVGAYDSGTKSQNVFIGLRSGAAYDGLVAGDFAVKGSNVDTPAVTAVSAATDPAYNYTLTVEKGSTPAALADGDYIQLRVEKDAPAVTAVSSLLTVYGV